MVYRRKGIFPNIYVHSIAVDDDITNLCCNKNSLTPTSHEETQIN